MTEHLPIALETSQAGPVLTIDRGRANSPTSEAVLVAIQDCLVESAGRCVLLRGTGTSFLIDGSVADRGVRQMIDETCELITNHPLPVLVVAESPPLDAGLELALACDLRFVQRGLRVGFPAAATGWLPSGGGQRLLREGGQALATRMLLLGASSIAGEDPALDRFLNISDEALADATSAFELLATRGQLALEALKTALRIAADLPLQAGIAIEADLACLLLPTEDRAEGLAAFRARRDPVFRGR